MRILTHGGAGSDPSHEDATDQAARIAQEALAAGHTPLEAACHATAHLEDDDRFNAGTGSYLRADGRTVEMDAACMDQAGTFGAVAAIQRVRHPVFVARYVAQTEHIVLSGDGARQFARSQGVPDWDPSGASDERHAPEPGDTVGCVIHHQGRFAAALSSGGTKGAPQGRVGDVPLPGCGLHAGPAGAIAATGHGETIALRLTAMRAYDRLEAGTDPSQVVQDVLDAFPEDRSIGLLAIDAGAGDAGSNREMASSHLSDA